MALILYLGGVGSSGTKPKFLRENGHQVLVPDLGDSIDGPDFSAAVPLIDSACAGHEVDIIIAVSRGAALAISLPGLRDRPLILLSPAIESFDHARSIDPDRRFVRIIHSASDEVIPVEEATSLLIRSGYSTDCLAIAGSGHACSDPETLQSLLDAVTRAELSLDSR